MSAATDPRLDLLTVHIPELETTTVYTKRMLECFALVRGWKQERMRGVGEIVRERRERERERGWREREQREKIEDR